MSTPATVPIFDPQGTLRDVPYEQMMDAVKAGGTIGVRFQAPDQSVRYVPANRSRDAISAGGKILPIEQQDVQHPGFWASLGSDLGDMAKGLWHAAVDPLTDTHEDLVRKLHEEQAADAAPPTAEHMAHGTFYRNVATPAAQAIGVNVPGMEQSAAEGDVAGVYGHAAAPAAAAAITEGAVRGIPAIGNAVKEVLPSTERAGAAFQEVSKVAGNHTVAVTPGLSDALMQYQQLVDAGGSRSLAVSKLLNRLTSPTAAPLTYDEARLFQSNISRLSADEAQRLTPVMKRQVGQIAAELSKTVETTAANAGKLEEFQGAMKQYRQAKQIEAVKENVKDVAVSTLKKAVPAAGAYYGVKKLLDLQ